MIINYLKIAIRVIRKESGFSILNILGLTIGLTSSIMIFQYANYEASFDSYHEKSHQIFRLRNDVFDLYSNELLDQKVTTFKAIHPGISEEIPEIENSTQLYASSGLLKNLEDSYPLKQIFYSSSSLFDIMTIPMISGEASDLNHLNKIFLSKTTALHIFGSTEITGRRIEWNDFTTGIKNDLEIGGVFDDFPDNSHLKSEAFVSIETLFTQSTFGTLTLSDVEWRWSQFYTYILTYPGTKVQEIENKVNSFVSKYRKRFDENQGRKQFMSLQPLSSIHLYSNYRNEIEPPGNYRVVMLLKIIAIMMIVLAWINYVNLANSRALTRAKEVSVRKTMGALKFQLGIQFLVEGAIFNLISFILSIVLVVLLVPYFHNLVEAKAFDHLLEFTHFWIFYGIFFVIGTVITGIYPSYFVMSKSIVRLKGNISHSSSGIFLRKAMVTLQIILAISMTALLLIINSQIEYMIDHDLGFKVDHTIVINTQPAPLRDSTYMSQIRSFKNELLALSGIEEASVSTLVPGQPSFFSQTGRVQNGNPNETVQLMRMAVDYDFFNYFEFEVIAGKVFNEKETRNSLVTILNRRATELLGFEKPEDALDEVISFPLGDSWKVVAVVENFYQQGLRYDFQPYAINLDTAYSGGFLSLKINSKNSPDHIINSVKEKFSNTWPGTPFDYFFLSEEFNNQYNSDKLFQNNFSIFTGIAIFICFLGLLGMSTFMISQKSKEISIRKVYGASGGQIFMLLTQEYARLLIIGSMLAIPAIYIYGQKWLSYFAFRINLSIWMFITPPIIIGIIIFGAISRQTIRTIRVNPAKILKEE